ncbi:hypothetical protein [Phenylobacterium sp.]|uniref:hypothetical protein n=1 Tax=Phenylobacterium sp. TaxID=1871053 RepID=UPI0035B2D2E0
MATTWNPSDKSSGAHLSNGDLTAVLDAFLDYARATTALSGKTYWEVLVSAGASEAAVGLMPLGSTDFNNYGSWIYADGTIYLAGLYGSTVSYGSSLANGVIVRLAVDWDNLLFWVKVGTGTWNGSAGADPAAGTGGFDVSAATIAGSPSAPVVTTGSSANTTCTARFASADWTYSAPSGFSSLDGGASFALSGLAAGVAGPSAALGALRPCAGLGDGAGGATAVLAASRPVAGAAAGAGSASGTAGAGPGVIAGVSSGGAAMLAVMLRSALLAGPAAGFGVARLTLAGGSLWQGATPTSGAWASWGARAAAWSRQAPSDLIWS